MVKYHQKVFHILYSGIDTTNGKKRDSLSLLPSQRGGKGYITGRVPTFNVSWILYCFSNKLTKLIPKAVDSDICSKMYKIKTILSLICSLPVTDWASEMKHWSSTEKK